MATPETIKVLWLLPTHGDGRHPGSAEGGRAVDVDHLRQVAQAADSLGYHGVLLPTERSCNAGDGIVLAHDERYAVTREFLDIDIDEDRRVGIDTFVLSGYPHLGETYSFGERVLPRLPLGHDAPDSQAPADLRMVGEAIANTALSRARAAAS